MKFPNKVISYEESILSKLTVILNVLSRKDESLIELYYDTQKYFIDMDYNKILESVNEWKISAYNYKHITTPLKSEEGSSYHIRFSKGAVNGSLGCNNFFGGYSIKNGILTIGNAGMTRKMCDPKTMENEAVLTENFLNAETKILTLKDNEEVGKIFLLGKDFYLVLD